MRRLVLALLILSGCAFGQVTNSQCPNATGSTPHCVILTWQPPAGTTIAPTGYNIYTGGTSAGNCAVVTAATCTKLTTVPLSATTLTFTYNSSTTVTLAEGSTHYFVATAVNGTTESGPSNEVSVVIPFLVPGPPTSLTGVGK